MVEEVKIEDSVAVEAMENVIVDEEVEEKQQNLLSLLRAIFKDPAYVRVEGGIQAYVLPRTDAHQV